MNPQLQAMLEMAAVRDALVVWMLAAVAAVLLSVGLLRAATLPRGVQTVMVNAQLVILLAAWIAMLVLVGMR